MFRNLKVEAAHLGGGIGQMDEQSELLGHGKMDDFG